MAFLFQDKSLPFQLIQKLGLLSKLFYIADIIPPRFLTEPSQSNIDANTKALDCDIFGLPKPTIEWYKNSKLLVPGNLSSAVEITNDNKR